MSYDLAYRIEPELLTLSTNNSFVIYITNRSNKPIIFENEKEIKGKDRRELEDGSQPDYPPGFYLCFSYGVREGDICTSDVAEKIDIHLISHSDTWSIARKVNKAIGVYWVVSPAKTGSLYPNESLVMQVESVQCNSALGAAYATFQLWIDGSRDEYKCDMIKCPKQIINFFGPEEKDYSIGANVTMKWDLISADQCEVYFDGKRMPAGLNVEVVTLEQKTYRLVVQNKAGYEAMESFEPEKSIIKRFEFENYSSNNQVKLVWDTEHVSRCEINGQDMPISGTDTFEVSGDTEFELAAYNQKGEKAASSKLKFSIPIIVQFEIEDALRNTDISSNSKFIALEEVANLSSIPTLIVPYAAPSPPDPPDPEQSIIIYWSTQNADYNELSYYTQKLPKEGNIQLQVPGTCNSITLTSYAECGYYVSKDSSL